MFRSNLSLKKLPAKMAYSFWLMASSTAIAMSPQLIDTKEFSFETEAAQLKPTSAVSTLEEAMFCVAKSHKHPQREEEAKKTISIHTTLAFQFAAGAGTLPPGFYIEARPYLITPDNKKYTGKPISIFLDSPNIIPDPVELQKILVPKGIEGFCTIGCELTLGKFSPAPTTSVFFNMRLVSTDKYVSGVRDETIQSQVQRVNLFLLLNDSHVFTLSTNGQLPSTPCHRSGFKHLGERECIEVSFKFSPFRFPGAFFGEYKFTPFAKAPNGQVYHGKATVVDLDTTTDLPLHPIVIPKPICGNYFVGYEISRAGDNLALPTAFGTFSGVIQKTCPSGILEISALPEQSYTLGAIKDFSDVFKVTGNYEISKKISTPDVFDY